MRAKAVGKETLNCEHCEEVTYSLIEMRKAGAKIDLTLYTGDHPLKCSGGHLIKDAMIDRGEALT